MGVGGLVGRGRVGDGVLVKGILLGGWVGGEGWGVGGGILWVMWGIGIRSKTVVEGGDVWEEGVMGWELL